MSTRLPEPAGRLIDRTRTVAFTFDGRSYEGFEGDTIASALYANGVRVLSRSFKYHRPRGVFTMAGRDANTLVQVGPEPSVLADRRPITSGLAVTAQNVFGRAERDFGAALDKLGRFMPAGFYYKAFFKPKGSWAYWERVLRRMAGLGTVDVHTPHGPFDKQYLFADVAVIGAGPAGIAAAVAAAKAGAEVLLIDENPYLGGALAWGREDPDGSRLRALEASVAAYPTLSVMTDTVCNGWFEDNWLALIRENRLSKLRARAVVMAAGCDGQPAVFRNNDLPGVMLGSAAQRLIRLYGVKPGSRAVIVTSGAEGYEVALDLRDAGVEIACLADLRQDPPAAPGDTHFPVIAGAAVRAAVPGRGGAGVGGAEVARLSADGRLGTSIDRFACDLIVTTVGHHPAAQLLCQTGARLRYDDDAQMFRVAGLPETVFAAGSVDGIFGLESTIADGTRAGSAAAAAIGLDAKSSERPQSAPAGEGAPWPIFPHAEGKDFIDFDEDLQVKDILSSYAEGYDGIELVKRFSTVGMGPSQGRHSALTAARILSRAAGTTVDGAGVTTVRPPVGPEKIGHLAGRAFQPVRLTAMHHRHVALAARMMPAGAWMRPAYYGTPGDRDAAIHAEVMAVRENVGLIDVSTLGGIDIRGPEAAEFMNRFYTFAYLKQPVGRARYVLATDIGGVIIDDGVACRFGDEHFYVTTTTSTSDSVYRQMLWYNAQWRLKVDIANVTAAYAAVNIAGPKSRDVLAAIAADVDLSADACPYMGVREGLVAGLPARLLRVGFVGELGYEIHVPASCGEALWDALMEAGAAHGIRPFGVEAQRLLRLEKGHIIIGQDTDGLTFPDEAGMGWAVSVKKPYFVGARSVAIQRARPPQRLLVGFEMAKDDPLPEECHLVVRDDTITGRVTSVALSPVLGKIVGLAYVAPDQAEEGTAISIKLTDGRLVTARVVKPPFYDPEGDRQAL
ncbi:MAG: aminomethyltransferase [Rhodospirillaceae bacterium]|nr:aminomethyltransferase [Rhodospirillaceae bacterium]